MSLPLIKTPQINFNGAYWTLQHEIRFYLLVFVLLLLFKKYFFYIFDLITLFLFFNCIQRLGLNNILNFDTFFVLPRTWHMFYAGTLVYRIVKNFYSPKLFYDLVCLVFFIFAFKDKFTTGVALFILVLKFFDQRIKELTFLQPLFKLGMISYSLYLLHIIITPRIIGLCVRLFSLNNFAILLVFLFFALPVTLFISYYFYKFFEKPFCHRKI